MVIRVLEVWEKLGFGLESLGALSLEKGVERKSEEAKEMRVLKKGKKRSCQPYVEQVSSIYKMGNLGTMLKMGNLMGFRPPDRDEPNMKDDVHDVNYPIHAATLSFLNCI